jgi:hypothetical protein
MLAERKSKRVFSDKKIKLDGRRPFAKLYPFL